MRTLPIWIAALGLIIARVPPVAAKRPPCVPGRLLITSIPPPFADATAIVLTRRTAAIVDGCAARKARIKPLASGVRVKARWRRCRGVDGPARLDAVIAAPACDHLEGTFRAGATLPVQAERCPAATPVVPPLRVIPVAESAAGTFAPFAAQPPGSSDWYLVEQRGRIRIIRDGVFLEPPFLDIQTAIGTDPGERGLLGLAFHPDYARNGRFFTMATPATGNDGSYAPTNADAVVEWRRDPQNPDRARPTKVRDIVVLPTSAANHNGGTILFGPDARLYVGTGDGGGACESAKPGAAQDPATLFGKILRLDVDAAPPFASTGNPFADDARVYHYGLRNPFRFGFDRATGDLFIGDVGQAGFEEISVAPGGAAGLNFGWPAYEGDTQGTCGNDPLGGPSPYSPPILSIDRRDGAVGPFADYKSIIGGRVYHGTAIPALDGVYLFADFYGSRLGALRACQSGVHGPVAVPLADIPAPGGLSDISAIVEGTDGELYLTYGQSTRLGRLAPQ